MPLAHSLIRRSFCHSAHPPIVSDISFSLVLMSLALSLTSTIRRIDCAFISFVFPPANNNNKMPYCILHMVRYASSFTHSHTKTDGTRWKLFGTNWRQTRARRRRRTFFFCCFCFSSLHTAHKYWSHSIWICCCSSLFLDCLVVVGQARSTTRDTVYCLYMHSTRQQYRREDLSFAGNRISLLSDGFCRWSGIMPPPMWLHSGTIRFESGMLEKFHPLRSIY